MYIELLLISLLIISLLFCLFLFRKNKKLQKEHQAVNQKIAYIQKRVAEINLFKQKVEKYTEDIVEKANVKSKQCIDNMEQLCETKRQTVDVLESKINQLVLQQFEAKQEVQDLIASKEEIQTELDLLAKQKKIAVQQLSTTEQQIKNERETSTSLNNQFDNIEQLINIVDTHLDNNQHLR